MSHNRDDVRIDRPSVPTKHVAIVIGAAIRVYRESLASVLEACSRIRVVGTISSRSQLLSCLSSRNPDIVLVDTDFPEAGELVSQLRNRGDDPKVVICGVSGLTSILEWAETGAAGYVAKDCSLEDLVATIVAVSDGTLPCSGMEAAALFRHVGTLAMTTGIGPRRSAGSEALTVQETKVLQLIEEGLSNKEIADRLCIAVSTVKTHVHRVIGKLGARGRGQLAAWADAHSGRAGAETAS